MKTTKVTFFTNFEELKISLPPVPASKFWPEWFKKQKTPEIAPTQESIDRGGVVQVYLMCLTWDISFLCGAITK